MRRDRPWIEHARYVSCRRGQQIRRERSVPSGDYQALALYRMFQSGCSDFIAYFLRYRQPKNMRCGFSASLLKRPNVDAARLLDCAPIETLLIIMSCRSETN